MKNAHHFATGTKIIKCFLLGMIAFSLTNEALSQATSERVYTFGVVPQHSASKISRIWHPITSRISDQTGYKVKIVTAKDIPEFEQQLSKGAYDFAYMNPYHYVVFSQSPGYQAIGHQQDKKIHGIIVVRKDSPYLSLQDLQHKTLSFPSPAAFAASLLTRANLRQQNVTFTPKYVSSHDSVYLTVAKNMFPAGGGVIRTLNNMPEETRSELRILWKSKGYTPHALAAHPDTPPEVIRKVSSAFFDLAKDADGIKLLNAAGFKKGFVPAANSDWDDVRSLDIDVSLKTEDKQ